MEAFFKYSFCFSSGILEKYIYISNIIWIQHLEYKILLLTENLKCCDTYFKILSSAWSVALKYISYLYFGYFGIPPKIEI